MASRKKHLKWLESQLPDWVNAGLISNPQATAIRQHYHGSEHSLARTALSAIGAILFGLGVILFFAWNWDALHRFSKLGIIFTAIVLAHAGGVWFRRPSSSLAAAEGLSLLGTMLFGAGIWLVSQVYHIDEHWPNAFLLWGMGALAMAWVLPSALQGVLAVLLLAIWSGAETFTFSQTQVSAVWIMLVGVLPLAWRLRSRWLMFFGLSGFYLTLAFQLSESFKESLFYVLYSLAVLYLALGLWLDRAQRLDFAGLRDVMVIPAYAVILTIVFALSFGDVSGDLGRLKPWQDAGQQWAFWLALLAAMAVVVRALLPQRAFDAPQETDVFQLLLALVGLLLCHAIGLRWWAVPGMIVAFVMNLLFVGHCLLFILHGSRIQRGGEVAIGCLLFSVLVFARYSDLFESLLSRSLVFLVLGASLFVVGNFYSRHKKTDAIAAQEVSS